MGLLLFGLFFIFILLNIPIAISLAMASAVTLFVTSGLDMFSLFPDIIYASISKFTLLAIPFFILAGVIMEHAGISKRLIHFADLCVGHRRSGIILVTVMTAIFFAAISGSGPATVAAIGSILIPALVKNEFPKDSASALVASSGSIGIIIPPSIAFIVFTVVAGDEIPISVGRMFIAGIVPGLLLGLGLVAASLFVKRKHEKSLAEMQIAKEKASLKEIIKGFYEALWGLLIPVIILGGIYGGVFTPTEAAVVAVFYGLFVGFFLYREIRLKNLPVILVDASVQTAVVMLIVGVASVFAYIITTELTSIESMKGTGK